jgi:hypothetical protein
MITISVTLHCPGADADAARRPNLDVRGHDHLRLQRCGLIDERAHFLAHRRRVGICGHR